MEQKRHSRGYPGSCELKIKEKRKEHLKRNTTSDGNQISVKTEAMAKIVYHFAQLTLCHKHIFCMCMCIYNSKC